MSARILRPRRRLYVARGDSLAMLKEAAGRLRTVDHEPLRPLRANRPFNAGHLFDHARDGFANALLSWTGDPQKGLLLDVTSTGPSFKQLTSATNTSPVTYLSAAHGFSNGDVVVTGNIGGNLSANQTGLVVNAFANTFQLTTLEGQMVSGSGAYTAGGFAVDLTQATFVADLLGTREGTDVTLAGTTSSRGICNASSPITWISVPTGNPATVVFYDAAGGTDATNRIVLWQDGRIRIITVGDTPPGSTTIKCQPIRAPLWDGTTGPAPVLWFSNGFSATLNAATPIGADQLTVTPTGNDIPNFATAEGIDFGGGLYVTPANNNISLQIGQTYDSPTQIGIFEL